MACPTFSATAAATCGSSCNVQIPRRLSDEQRDLFEQLSATITDENLRADESIFSRLRRALHPHHQQ